MGRPYHRVIKAEPLLYSACPGDRLKAAQAQRGRARRSLVERAQAGWPPFSPGSVNAWLLLVTTKPPSWREPLLLWPEAPLALGEAHEGFYYPDPLGFWAEVRRWVTEVLRPYQPAWSLPEMLAVSTLVHLEDDRGRFDRAVELARPGMIVFFDEPSVQRGLLDGARLEPHFITDPHRQGQVYEGFWARTPDGTIVGKAPQHPATHKLYRWDDMRGYLASAPRAPDC